MKRKFNILAVAILLCSVVLPGVISCSDDPDELSRYTSTAEYASDFIVNREKFSDFVKVVTRSNMLSLLGTYGSYTVFAPTNDAFAEYLAGKGLSSVDELSDDDCDTITFTHIIEQAFFTTDYNDGTYPVLNMLDRTLTITCDSDTVSVPGEVNLVLYINKTAQMIAYDDSVENGVVHTMGSVIGATNDMLPTIMGNDSTISLFYEALVLTHMDDSLEAYIDSTYSVGSDSIDWTNDALVMSTATEYDNVAYMENRYYNFTAFVPQNSVFEAYGITDIEGLIELAHQCYDPVYPDDADIEDYTDRSNALNRFVSYHLLDRLGTYYGLTCVDGSGTSYLANCFARNKWDIADWYETMMPYSIIKCSFPSGSASGLYINRRGVQARADSRGYKIAGAKVTPASDVDIDQTAVNGVYHYISDFLSYGYHPYQDNNGTVGVYTQEDVFTERLRIDCATLSPDFMTSGARGHYTNSGIENGKYGYWDATSNSSNVETCLGFKAGSAKNFEFTDNTHVHVRPRVLTFWSYQADEVTIKGRYDLTVKLPPVPAGDWEIRMGTCIDFDSRGIVQYYIDDVPQGIPFDMRKGGDDWGWTSDDDLGDEEQIKAFDKQFHYKGWMKGPKSYGNSSSTSGSSAPTDYFRNYSNTLRKVIGTYHSYGSEYHYLRLQQKMESSENELNFDYIELCPSTVYNNPDVAEDKW